MTLVSIGIIAIGTLINIAYILVLRSDVNQLKKELYQPIWKPETIDFDLSEYRSEAGGRRSCPESTTPEEAS